MIHSGRASEGMRRGRGGEEWDEEGMEGMEDIPQKQDAIWHVNSSRQVQRADSFLFEKENLCFLYLVLGGDGVIGE
ncbi:hypothetical protein EYC84_010326 [Monilinia fructicola]|nr:hypothetical protein EYC84_010326 [Monilinia fructicola]